MCIIKNMCVTKSKKKVMCDETPKFKNCVSDDIYPSFENENFLFASSSSILHFPSVGFTTFRNEHSG